MIFKTFDSDIDKWTAKIGLFGKSFYDIFEAKNQRNLDIYDLIDYKGMSLDEAKNQVKSFWGYLFPKTNEKDWFKNSLGEIISKENIDSYIKELDLSSAKNKLKEIFNWQEDIKNGETTWSEYFETLQDGTEKYIPQLIKSTDDLSKLEGQDLVNACNNARQAAIDHNNALKQQTLGAKAAAAGMKLLSIAGNMAVSALISWGISKIWKVLTNDVTKYAEAADKASEQAKKSSDNAQKLSEMGKELANGTKSADELTEAFRDQLKVMGYTNSEIDDLISKYNGLAGAMDEAKQRALEQSKADAYISKARAEELLIKSSRREINKDIIISAPQTGNEDLDHQINEILSNAAVQSLVSAGAGAGWVPKSTDAEGLYQYYMGLKEISSLIQETASKTDDKSLIDLGNFFNITAYGEVTSAIDKLSEGAEQYKQAIDMLHSSDAQLELANYLKANSINSQEAFDDYIEGITNSKEYSEEYKQVLIDTTNSAFPQFAKSGKSAVQEVASETKKLLDLEELNKQIDSIQAAYSTVSNAQEEYKKNGFLSVDTMQELLSLGDEYLQYLFDENGNLTLNKEAFEKLAIAKLENLKISKINELNNWINGLEKEGLSADELTEKYQKLAAAKIMSGEMPELLKGYTDKGGNWVDVTQLPGYKEKLAAIKAIDSAIAGVGQGGLDKQNESAKDRAKKIKEINKKLAEISKQESLDILKSGIEEAKQYIDQFSKAVELQGLKFELADDSDYFVKMDALSSKYDLLQGKTAAMRNEFERLNGITPTSADEAQELANRMSALGDEMRSNVKDVISLRREMELLNVNMISSAAEDAQSQLDRVMKRLDRDINNIVDGNIFSDSVFNIHSMLPQVSESALSKKRKENDRLISEEERYQNDINRIISTSLQMQKEKNAQARAEERASLLEDLNELKGVVTTKSQEIKQEAVNKANETNTEVMNKVGEIQTGITTAIDNIANMTINPPQINAAAWDNLEKEISDRFGRILSSMSNPSANAMGAVGLASQFVGHNNLGFRFSGGRNEEWCADFVSYIANMAGIPIEQLPRSAGVIDFYNFFAEHGGNLSTPMPGDLVIFNKNKHIGFVKDVTENGIVTIEGNTRDSNNQLSRVTENNYSFDDIKRKNMTFGRYASGGYADGYAVVGDNPSGANVKRPELAVYPDGHVEVVGENGVELKDFPSGTRIIPYDKTREILKNAPSIPRFANGTNEAQRKKIGDFNDKITKYSTPSYYDKSFSKQYADYASSRNISITNIKATVDKMADLDINSDNYKNLRKSALDMVQSQNLSDAGMLLGVKEDQLKKTKSDYQELYNDLSNAYKEYIDAVNDENSEEIYDEEVISGYINALSDLEDKISDVDDKLSSSLQDAIGYYQRLDSFKHAKGREAANAIEGNISDLEYLKSLTDDPVKQTEYSKLKIDKYQELIAQEEANQALAHNAANQIREEFANEFGGKYNMDNWFDSEGEFTDAYREDLSLIMDEEEKRRVQLYASRVQTEKKAYMESNKNMKDARKSLYDTNKQLDDDLLNRLKNAMDKEVKALEKSISEQKKALDFEISQYAARNTLLQKHYDILNAIADEQHNITKELSASLTMSEYLDAETRKLIFNQEDYNGLKSELVDLEEEANKIQRDYLNDIKNADAENISKITADYERQYELLMKNYEISKADLEVAKKKQQLNNVLNERNVQMLINDKWQWVANTQDVINAQNELEDAEYNQKKAKNSLDQSMKLQSLQAHQDTLEMQKNYLDAELTDMTERWDKIMERMEGNTESVSEVLDLIAVNGGQGLHKIVNRVGEGLSKFYEMLTSEKLDDISFDIDIDYSAIMSTLPKDSFLWKYLNNKRNNKIDTLGWNEKYNKYASGTKSAESGLARINEIAPEGIMTKSGELIPFANLSGGEMIFNHKMMENLWHQAQMPTLPELPNHISGSGEKSNTFTGDINIYNPFDCNDFMRQLTTQMNMQNAITNRMPM